MAEHQGQAPAEPIPIPADNSQAEIDRCVVVAGAKINVLGMNLWKAQNTPTRTSPTCTTNPADLP
eukprot:10495277-Alexandrium_andersonii.AAC.1